MRQFYKATILLSTENLYLDPKTGNYEGCDPDTFTDHGVVHSFKGTLDEVRDQVYRQVAKIDSWELYQDDTGVGSRLEWSCEGEHDYRTPLEERIPFIENYSLYLELCTEQEVNPSLLQTKEVL